jgi:hypothetical protein
MSTEGATIEAGEIALADDQSVWIQFTTPYAIPLEIEAVIKSGSTSVFVVDVYTNFEDNIEDIVHVAGSSDVSQPVTFTSTRNTSYAIRLASSEDVDFALYIRSTGLFDSYVSDYTYTTYPFSLANAPLRFGGDNLDAGAQGNEPSLGGYDDNTVWVKLASDSEGPGILIVDTIGSDFDTVLQIFEDTGDVSTYLQIGENDDLNPASEEEQGSLQSRLSLSINNDTNFAVRVMGYDALETGNIVLNVDFKPSDPATALAALRESFSFRTSYSTIFGTNIYLTWEAFGAYGYRVQFTSNLSSWTTIEDVFPLEDHSFAYSYDFSLPGAGPHYVRVEFLEGPF